MKTMQEFIKEQRVHMADPEMVDRNPNMEDDEWRADHYKLVLRRKGKQMTVYFSMGVALCREPELAEVLSTLALDSADVENARGFEDWASEYGYDTGSRKAVRLYDMCKRQAARLETFLGGRAYDSLLWETDRD